MTLFAAASSAAKVAVAGGILLALASCSSAPSNPGAARGIDHTTAATGFGLGPQDFNSNGGAFGPDQLSR